MPEEYGLMLKFLDYEMAKRAIDLAVKTVFANFQTKREIVYVVLLGPKMQKLRRYPDYRIVPEVIAESGFGDPREWPHKFDDIAKSKAVQAWHGRSDGGTDVMPHLLFSGDTPFWGSTYRHRLACACSGVEPHNDRLISSMTIDFCVASCYAKFLEWRQDNPNKDFLT